MAPLLSSISSTRPRSMLSICTPIYPSSSYSSRNLLISRGDMNLFMELSVTVMDTPLHLIGLRLAAPSRYAPVSALTSSTPNAMFTICFQILGIPFSVFFYKHFRQWSDESVNISGSECHKYLFFPELLITEAVQQFLFPYKHLFRCCDVVEDYL